MLLSDVPSGGIKLFASILFTLLALNGLLLNTLWALILYMGHRHFSRRPFYIISRHLLLCDLLCISAQVVLAVPLTLLDYHTAWEYKRTKVFHVFSTFETVGHLSTLVFVFLQALSQIAPFLRNQKRIIYHLSASGTLICMIGWMFNIVLMLLVLATKCQKDFNLFDFHFYYICKEAPEISSVIWWILDGTAGLVLLSSYGIYGMGIKKVNKQISAYESKQNVTQDDRRELVELHKRKLIILQGLLIASMLTIRTIGYIITPFLANFDRNLHTFGSVITNCIEMVSSSVHPCIYIYFNERAHKYFLKILSKVIGGKVQEDSEIEAVSRLETEPQMTA